MKIKVAFLLLCNILLMYGCEQSSAVGVFSAQNKRSHQEDTFYHGQVDGGYFFGVYDGHGGDQVAWFLQQKLHTYFEQACGSVREKMSAAFQRADNDDFVQSHKKIGSTASVVFIENKSGSAHCAHAGDSRVLLERKGTVGFFTQDHKPTRVDECERIERAGGFVMNYRNALRVNGCLAVSRAIGDRCIDKKVVTAEPEYTNIPLTKENHFLIAATDGFWDMVGNQEAVNKLCEYYNFTKNLTNVAYLLGALAIQRGSKDNITVMVVDLLSIAAQ